MVWTTPRTWVDAETDTAAIFNTHISGNFDAIGTWAAYTPTLSGFTLGNATLAGSTVLAGKLVLFRIEFTFGSTSVAAGQLQFSLPDTAAGAGTSGFPIEGRGWVYDTSLTASTYYFPTLSAGGANTFLRNEAGSVVNSTTITWATGDRCVIVGSYEAA